MSALDFWYPNPHVFDALALQGTAWDTCTLGGNQLPGICTVDIEKGRKLDVKMPPGSHGATITDQGYEPAKVSITQVIWTPDQWTKQQSIQATLEPLPNKSYAAPSFDIMHPACALRQVKAVIIKTIRGPKKSSSIRGAMEFTYECVQFFPPPKNLTATNTPKNSIPPKANALLTSDQVDPTSNGVPAPLLRAG